MGTLVERNEIGHGIIEAVRGYAGRLGEVPEKSSRWSTVARGPARIRPTLPAARP